MISCSFHPPDALQQSITMSSTHPNASHPAISHPHSHSISKKKTQERRLPFCSIFLNSSNMAFLSLLQVFKRSFTMWSCFSFALSISGLYATIMATFSYPLYAGGAAAVVWCWLIGGAGGLALAISVAEISSAYPTSGEFFSFQSLDFKISCHMSPFKGLAVGLHQS
jgi:hypothetical protein